jgi:FKBP-type peptidyl-prolyl cis-trans isomerase (trigger factor)
MAKTTSTPQKTESKTTVQKKAESTAKAPKLILDNTVFQLTVPADQIEMARQQALKSAKTQVKQDGFRKGHVPAKLVEKNVNDQYLTQRVLEIVLPPIYQQYLEQNNLKPLTEPDVKPLSMDPDKDWTFEVAIAQKPVVDAAKYAQIVKATKKSHELWQEKKDKKDDEKETSQEALRQQQLQVLLTALLEGITVQIPELLLRRETEQQLHELEHQLEHMKMTMQDFLRHSQKKMEDVQQDYAARALGNLQVELLLGAIIEAAKLEVAEQEVTDALKQQLDKYPEKTKPQITTRDIQYVHATLLKQKALDHLLHL